MGKERLARFIIDGINKICGTESNHVLGENHLEGTTEGELGCKSNARTMVCGNLNEKYNSNDVI